ncbi:MAG: NAD-dependent epimerase/dehydratase family protein, partial [Patescibacteria group bacterium]
NIINACHKFGVKKLLNLGSSCFPEGTVIHTKDGFKNIENVLIGDKVLTHLNRFKKVSNLTKKNTKSLICIQPLGWNKIYCTEEHKILIKNKGFVEAKNLLIGDIVEIPIYKNNLKCDMVNIIQDSTIQLHYDAFNFFKRENTSVKQIKKIYNLTQGLVYGWEKGNKPLVSYLKNDSIDAKNGLAELCGYFVADGWLSGKKTGKRGGSHNVFISPGYDEPLADRIKYLFNSIFGVLASKRLYRTSYKIGCSNKLIYSFFSKFYNTDTHKANSKIIPKFILSMSDEALRLFIKAYWECDGHFSKRQNKNTYIATAASVSKELIHQLQYILACLGIFSTVSYIKKPKKCIIEGRLVNQQDQYHLWIRNRDAEYFIKNILQKSIDKDIIYYRSCKIEKEDKFFYTPIIKMNYIDYSGEVYDLSVEDDLSYTANGFSVHNCIFPKETPQPMKEEYLLTGKLEPSNEYYAIAKIAAIKMCSAYNKQYGTNFISAMPPNLYGINDNFDLQNSHLLPALIRKFHEAKINNTTVTLWGDGSPRREFMYVDDLADGLIFLMNNYDYNGEDFINIGVGEDLPIHLIASAIMTEVGYKGNIIWDGSKPNGTMEKLLDSTKINELGWKPKTNLVTGIHNMYKWFIKNYPNIKGI